MEDILEILVPLSLALITFGIGINITADQVEKMWKQPQMLLIALGSQMIALPIIAFIIALVIPAAPSIKVGLIILAASPGGSTSGFITYLFKGNTALSIMLTTVNAFLTLFTIPIIVNFSLGYFMDSGTHISLPFISTMKEIFVVTLIPAALGIAFRVFQKDLALKVAKYAKPIMMLILGAVFSLMIFGKRADGSHGLSMQEAANILPWCLLLNVSCMLVGYILPRYFGLDHAARLTTAVESGVHNTTLAFLITFNLLHSPELAKPALVYAGISFWTAIIFCSIIESKFFRE